MAILIFNKSKTDIGDILNDNDFFVDVVDTPKEGIEQHKKQECLKSVIDKGKLGHKWTHGRVGKASDETINKTYSEYEAKELSKKGEKTGKALGKLSLTYIQSVFLDGLRSGM